MKVTGIGSAFLRPARRFDKFEILNDRYVHLAYKFAANLEGSEMFCPVFCPIQLWQHLHMVLRLHILLSTSLSNYECLCMLACPTLP